MSRRRLDPIRNWWTKLERTPDGCWVWTAGTDQDGYGKFAIGLGGQNQIHTRAHRFAYEVFIGPIPDGMVVCHSCDNPPCANPDHLWLGTPIDNNADKVAKDRQAKVWGLPLTRARQTHCKYGHEFTPENTYVSGRGHRSCKTCRRESARRYYWSRKGVEGRWAQSVQTP